MNELKEEKRTLRETYKGENQILNKINEFIEKKINEHYDIYIENCDEDDNKANKDN